MIFSGGHEDISRPPTYVGSYTIAVSTEKFTK